MPVLTFKGLKFKTMGTNKLWIEACDLLEQLGLSENIINNVPNDELCEIYPYRCKNVAVKYITVKGFSDLIDKFEIPYYDIANFFKEEEERRTYLVDI